jgi:hypothetical protein
MIKSVIFLLFFWVGNALAYDPTDVSALENKLGPKWQLTNTQEQKGISKMVEYTNAMNVNKEVLLLTTMVKPDFLPSGPDKFASQLFESTKDLMAKNECTYENIPNVPQTSGAGNEWGIYWQCAKNSLTGFMFFINADPKTMYTITYKAMQSYPLKPTSRDNMNKILKNLQLCYKSKTCTPLI